MEFLKPSTLNVVWAEQGQKIKPDEKILQGWVGFLHTRCSIGQNTGVLYCTH